MGADVTEGLTILKTLLSFSVAHIWGPGIGHYGKVSLFGLVLMFQSQGILMEALNVIISIHEPRFKAVINDLTDFQLSLLKATVDGVTRFSASDVIEEYRLNSSANVRRIKDALKKKEVLTFNEKDEPVIMDSLFEYWVTKYYFEK